MHTDELQLVLWSGAASLLASWTGVILTPRVVISHPVVIRTLCYIIRNNDPFMWHLSDWYNIYYMWVVRYSGWQSYSFDKVKVDLRIGKGRHYRWPVLISWYCYAKSVQLWLDSRPGPGSRCGPPSRKWDCAWLVTHDIISTVTSSTDNNNSAQSKYHGDHQHPAQFEFMTLIINKEEARSRGRILKNKWKICCHSETITAFIPPAHVSCAQNVTGVIRDSELMSALTIFYMSKHWLREQGCDGGKMRHYEPLIGINEAHIHHIRVTAHKSGPRGPGGTRRIRAPSGSNKCRANGKTAKE